MATKRYLISEGKELEINIAGIKKVLVEECLGEGGFAKVWKVVDTTTSQKYVLKHVIVNSQSQDEKVDPQRIENEAGVDISSEYVIKCFGVKRIEKDNFIMLFEFIEGTDLKTWIRDNRSIPWKTKYVLFVKILQGVRDAHEKGIIHRDLKPENIMITTNNIPKIIDFGIAKFKDKNITKMFEIRGSLAYMDPNIFSTFEQFKDIDYWYDVYSMGIILYEFVMGKNPYEAYCLESDKEYQSFLVNEINNGKQNILEIAESEYTFNEEPLVAEVIRQSTMFEIENRLKSIDDMIRLLGEPKYIKLREFLSEEDWQEADQETRRLMLQIVNCSNGVFTVQDILDFPCSELKTLDQLWQQYSDSHFGFSVQQQVYKDVGEKILTFAERVGWKKGKDQWPESSADHNFTQAAPKGYLPTCLFVVRKQQEQNEMEPKEMVENWIDALKQRFGTCESN